MHLPLELFECTTRKPNTAVYVNSFAGLNINFPAICRSLVRASSFQWELLTLAIWNACIFGLKGHTRPCKVFKIHVFFLPWQRLLPIHINNQLWSQAAVKVSRFFMLFQSFILSQSQSYRVVNQATNNVVFIK